MVISLYWILYDTNFGGAGFGELSNIYQNILIQVCKMMHIYYSPNSYLKKNHQNLYCTVVGILRPQWLMFVTSSLKTKIIWFLIVFYSAYFLKKPFERIHQNHLTWKSYMSMYVFPSIHYTFLHTMHDNWLLWYCIASMASHTPNIITSQKWAH